MRSWALLRVLTIYVSHRVGKRGLPCGVPTSMCAVPLEIPSQPISKDRGARELSQYSAMRCRDCCLRIAVSLSVLTLLNAEMTSFPSSVALFPSALALCLGYRDHHGVDCGSVLA